MCADIKFICWAYEMGDNHVGEENPAYVEGEDIGGNLHFQVYFETTKQYRQSEIRKLMKNEDYPQGFHLEWSYAPKSAEAYAVKADHTLVDGPWEWGSKANPGQRNDLAAARKAIVEEKLDYKGLRLTGKHDQVCAKYKNFIKEIARDVVEQQLKPIEWPIVFKHEDKQWVMDKPDPSNKKRNWWIVSDPDWGKSYWANETLGDFKVYSIPVDKTYRFEDYDDEDLIVYDDKAADFAEYSDVLNTHKLRQQVPGKVRYETKYWKRNHTRNVIVLTNKTIEEVGFSAPHVTAMHSRFIVIDLRKPVQEGYSYNTNE